MPELTASITEWRPASAVIVDAKRAIARLEMPPASARYLKEYLRPKTPMERHLEQLVKERGIREGTLALHLARQIDRSVVHNQVLRIGGARFTVKDPAQALERLDTETQVRDPANP